ncbi:hypothetical protein HRbin25_00678 [bacterium HR25]|nr:hypothetical protein HRbin25_00678 [bacterium HR25]
MDDPRPVREGDEVRRHHREGLRHSLYRGRRGQPPLLPLVEPQGGRPPGRGIVQRLVAEAHQLPAAQRAQQPVVVQDGPQQGAGQDQRLPLVLHQGVLRLRVDGQGRVPGQRPGCGGPGQQEDRPLPGQVDQLAAGLLPQPELHPDGGVGRVLPVALGHLMVREGGAAARAVRHGAVILVDQPPLPQRLHDPPAALDILVAVGDVGVLHVQPEGDSLRQCLPLPQVAHHVLPAASVELGDADPLDLRLAGDAELLLHLQLRRQAVGVPAGAPGHAVALHRLVADDDVLEDAGQNVMDARAGVGVGRPLVEGELALFRPLLYALAEDVPLPPEAKDFLL